MLAHYHCAITAKSQANKIGRGMCSRSEYQSDNPRSTARPVERRGVAPRFLPCDGRVLLLDDRPDRQPGKSEAGLEPHPRIAPRAVDVYEWGSITQLLRPVGAPGENRRAGRRAKHGGRSARSDRREHAHSSSPVDSQAASPECIQRQMKAFVETTGIEPATF